MLFYLKFCTSAFKLLQIFFFGFLAGAVVRLFFALRLTREIRVRDVWCWHARKNIHLFNRTFFPFALDELPFTMQLRKRRSFHKRSLSSLSFVEEDIAIPASTLACNSRFFLTYPGSSNGRWLHLVGGRLDGRCDRRTRSTNRNLNFMKFKQ